MSDGYDSYVRFYVKDDEPASTRAPKASSVCPVCGIDTPHAHRHEELLTEIVRLRNVLAELVAADDAHKAWCERQRAKPAPPFPDYSQSVSSLGLTVKEDPERAAIVERINEAWAAARAALVQQEPKP